MSRIPIGPIRSTKSSSRTRSAVNLEEVIRDRREKWGERAKEETTNLEKLDLSLGNKQKQITKTK